MPRRKLHSPLLAASLLAATLLSGCRKQEAPPSDAALTSAVGTRLAGDAAIAAEPIQSSVQTGVATLTGAVSSDAARALAANDAAQVPGVRTVVNNLTVQTAAAPPPALPISTPTPEPTPAPARATSDRRPRSTDVRPSRGTSTPARAREEQRAEIAPPTAVTAPIERAATPTAPPTPVVRNLTLPAGSVLPVRITQTLDSATTQQGEAFSGTIASDVVSEGATVLRQGTAVSGRVTAVQEAAHFKGSALLSIELTGVNPRGERVSLSTEPYTTEGKGRGKNTAIKTGGGAAVGAILGGIFGGGKGAAIGAAAGGGAGAGVNGITRGEQVQIPAESLIRFRLASPATVRVSGASASPAANPTGPDSDTNPQLNRRPLN